MSGRGKDSGFHPHPGDPWHPGWSSEEEPLPEASPPVAEEETEAPAGPEPVSDAGPVEPAAEGESPEAEAAVTVGGPPTAPGPAPEPPAEEPTEEVGGSIPAPVVAREEPTAPLAAAGAFPQTLFEWAEGQLPLGEAPAETAAEPEHLPPPWAPEEPAAGEPPAMAPIEPAARVEANGEWAGREAPGEPGPEEAEVEVEDWLVFAAGPAPGTAPGPGPDAEAAAVAEDAGGAVEGTPPAAAHRRRFWPFGQRDRRAEALPEEAPEAAAGPEQAGESSGPQPPPWSPEVAEAAPGVEARREGEAEGAAFLGEVGEGGEEAGEAAEEWGPPAVPAVEAGQGGGEEPPPPPWLTQSELDRAAAIPVIPSGLPGEEAEGEAEEEEWVEEEGEEVPADWWLAAGPEPGEAAPALPPEVAEVAEGDEWEAFPEPGMPVGEAGAPRGDWEEPPGGSPETAGVPTMEIPPPGAFDYPRRPAPREIISEEMFAGRVTSEHRDLAQEVAAADTAEAQLQAVSAPMAGLESGVVGFGDVVHLGEEEEEAAAVEPARSDLPVRVVTAVVLGGILLGAMWVGGEFLAGFIGLLAILGLAEFYGTLRRAGYRPLTLFGLLGGAGLLAGTWFYGLLTIPVAVVAVTGVCFFYYTLASRRGDPLTNGSLTVLGVVWVAGTLAFAFPIAAAPYFERLVLALVAAVVATDVGAFFAGRSWGSRPLAPVLSPYKTVEGLAGGVVLGIGAAVAVGYFLEPLNIRIGAALGLVVAVMAPLGDLAESMVKRSLGVKDMGSTLPGHGGILDRVDAFLFVLPAVWVLYETLGLLR